MDIVSTNFYQVRDLTVHKVFIVVEKMTFLFSALKQGDVNDILLESTVSWEDSLFH